MKFERGFISPYFVTDPERMEAVLEDPYVLVCDHKIGAQIAANSAVDGGVVVARMIDGSGNVGFDAARKEYVDLVEAGIVDPAKVVRTAPENAASVASVLLLTEAIMTEIPEPKREPATSPDMAL